MYGTRYIGLYNCVKKLFLLSFYPLGKKSNSRKHEKIDAKFSYRDANNVIKCIFKYYYSEYLRISKQHD